MSWACNAQAPPALTGTLALSSSKPFRLSSFSDASPAFLFSCTCLSPLLEHSAYSCQTQGHQRLKELGQEESSGFVCPSSRASGTCVCVCACECTQGCAHVCLHMHMCACTVLSVCVWACMLTCSLVFMHVCVCVCVCALCACVKREENPDCLEISQKRACLLPGTGHCHCPQNRALGESFWTSGQRRGEMK